MKNEEALRCLDRIINDNGIYGTSPLSPYAIEALRTAISALESQRWIPVTERLPEIVPCKAGTAYSEAVVVLTEDMTVCTAVWNGKHWIADFDYWEASSNVTHWKWVLPLPQKEEII